MTASKYNPIFEFEYMIQDQPYILKVTSVSTPTLIHLTLSFYRFWAMSWATNSPITAKIGNIQILTPSIKVIPSYPAQFI